MSAETNMCGPGFKILIENAGCRGLAAVVRRKASGPGFLLQSRGVAHGDGLPGKLDSDINVLTETGLRFCPYCGTDLEKYSMENEKLMGSLLKHHEKYIE